MLWVKRVHLVYTRSMRRLYHPTSKEDTSSFCVSMLEIVEDFIQAQIYIVNNFKVSVHNLIRHCDGSFVQWFCSHCHAPCTDQFVILISTVDVSRLLYNK